jgi:hypothetical protein
MTSSAVEWPGSGAGKTVSPRRGVFALVVGVWFAALAAFRIIYGKGNLTAMIVLFLIAAAAYGSAALYLCRIKGKLPRKMWIVLLVASVGLRLSLFTVSPRVLTEDVYRYLWDGKIQTEGYNPYLHAPADAELEELTGEGLHDLVPHKSAQTSYPPLSQLVFRFAYAAGSRLDRWREPRSDGTGGGRAAGALSNRSGEPRSDRNPYLTPARLLPLRLCYLMAEAGIVLLLLRLVPGGRGGLIYLMCPLIVVETYAGMHIDILGVLFLLAAFIFFIRGRYYPFLAAFVFSVLVKYVTGILVPLFLIAYLRREGRGRPPLVVTADVGLKIGAAGIFAFLFFLPFLDAGAEIFSQLRYYLRYWRFNGSLFYLVESFTGPRAAGYVRIVLTLGALLTAAFRKGLRLEDRIVLSIVVFFLLAPTVYPWYFLWIVPFFALRLRAAELVLTGVLFLSYYVIGPYGRTGIWRERGLFILIQYVPVYLVLLLDILRRSYVRDENRCGHRARAE